MHGDNEMFKVSEGAVADLERTAKDMLASGETTAPLLSPGGAKMFTVSSDKSQLRGVILSKDVDGTEFHLGLRK